MNGGEYRSYLDRVDEASVIVNARQPEPQDEDEFEAEDVYVPSPADLQALDEMREVRQAIGEKGDSPDADLPEEARKQFPSLDWEVAFKMDFTKVNWLPGKFIEVGQQVSLVGDGKVGKSLFILDWALKCASGKPFLGDKAHDPLTVMYVDRENSIRDIVTRLKALGATEDVLSRLVYKSFPQFTGTLDQSAKAASELVHLALHHKADIVILDTVSRFIGGKENENDTWLQLYQMVHARLKKNEVACVRLDHFGKDADKGSRGGSAKSQDVDTVWELKKVSETTGSGNGTVSTGTHLKMVRTHTRSGLGEDLFQITRLGQKVTDGMWIPGRTTHKVSDEASVAEADKTESEVVDQLIAANAPKAGRDQLTKWMKENGFTTYSAGRMGAITAALKERRLLGETK